MDIKKYLSLLIFVMVFKYMPAQNAYQDISVIIDVSNSSIQVENTFDLPNNVLDNDNSIYMYLNKDLIIENLKGAKIVAVENANKDTQSYVNKYLLTLEKSSKNSFTIFYKGVIKDAIEKSAAEYARGFSETKGTISEIGVYLAGSTYWLPEFENKLLSSFDLKVKIDKDWSIVSQGERTKNEVQKNIRNVLYHSPEPMDEIYLIGAKWAEYSKMLGNVEVQAFLRTPDKDLADRYLNSTSEFLTMYENLIGEYPYTKFALVENFWETGYGMPSFTLLGEKIIRFPWILYSSYPHELLHNYWGNGVFVDYSRGNWCEGVTAYMADHLIQEQMGNGAEYRQTTLQKFSDYVNEENDMPINQFLSRNNPAEESIGYGKVLMVNNMLRTNLGDDIFIKAYQKFYKDNKFTKASFSDIQKSFEGVSKQDLSSFFEQWIDRKGTPSIEVLNVNSTQSNNEFKLSFTLKQVQKEDVFNVAIPIAVYLNQNSEVIWKKVDMNKKEQNFSFTFNQKPLKIEVDPEFDIMRRVSRSEVPSSLSQVFGAKALSLIIPSKGEFQATYKELANIWKATQEAQGKIATILLDSEIEKIPTDQSVWVIGFENKFNNNDLQTSYASSFDSETIYQIKNLSKTGAIVYAVPNSSNLAESVGFVGASSHDAITALSSKLLHYGKYGYLGFEGDAANNVLKGSLPVLNSPLNVRISDGEITAKIIPRKALFETKR
ncbi:M1 family metallopeptidase [Gelidibacter sp.]|uniref:M1 family metallopeptidase n=1 Tax=Gelidibacter sp. TaxID=2018083 RepID=UPI002BCAEDF0|nr:M1 family aminopeptidase [Gelidibacter sp.]HUH28578.1 M1 family aminopeptidase [Gelidibacter sp.]